MLDGVFEYEDGLQNAVHDFFADIPQGSFQSKEFSNARFVRNLYERTWGKAAYRQNAEGGDLRILKSDLVGAATDNEFKKLLKKNPERVKIGFGTLGHNNEKEKKDGKNFCGDETFSGKTR